MFVATITATNPTAATPATTRDRSHTSRPIPTQTIALPTEDTTKLRSAWPR